MSRWPRGPMPRSSRCLPLRACGARPSRGGQSKGRWPSGENPSITRRVIFSEGRDLRVRKHWPDANRCTTCSRRGKRTPSGLPGACLGQAGALVAGVRTPPLRGEADPNAAWLAGKGPGKARRRFSRRDALRASAWRGRTQADALHSHRYVYDERVVKRRQRSDRCDAFVPGVQSPLLRGQPERGVGRLAGKVRR
jgi:hypothetical protein